MPSFAGKEGIMDTRAQESLRMELVQLLRKQKDILDARSLGAANEGEVVDYELRQEVILDICQILANSSES
jgi:hypothetical protein